MVKTVIDGTVVRLTALECAIIDQETRLERLKSDWAFHEGNAKQAERDVNECIAGIENLKKANELFVAYLKQNEREVV